MHIGNERKRLAKTYLNVKGRWREKGFQYVSGSIQGRLGSGGHAGRPLEVQLITRPGERRCAQHCPWFVEQACR